MKAEWSVRREGDYFRPVLDIYVGDCWTRYTFRLARTYKWARFVARRAKQALEGKL